MFETIVTENFPEVISDNKPQIQEAQKIPRENNAKTNSYKSQKLSPSI